MEEYKFMEKRGFRPDVRKFFKTLGATE